MFLLNTFSSLPHTLLAIGSNKLNTDFPNSWPTTFITALNFMLSFKPSNINKIFCLFWMKFILLPNLFNLFINFSHLANFSTLTTTLPTTSKFFLSPPHLMFYINISHKLGNLHNTIHMDVPKQYVGIDTLLQQNRLFINHNLAGFDNDSHSVKPQTFQHICDYLHKIDLSSSPKFHIIRTHRGHLHQITIQNFEKTLQKHFQHIPVSLISEPKQHQFDFDSFLASAR